ncbi:MAG: ketol-acid reductoisomerase [Cyclobacteriaceae bacterium]|nr:ketol-acid reductoisomerase [Cyclobacteriaceae bacterium]
MEQQTFYDSDADLKHIQSKSIGIIGYGNQGRAQALNLRDSGIVDISIGGIKDSSLERAVSDGFNTGTIEEVAANADILFLLIPDEVLPAIYQKSIAPHLKSQVILNFASGYNITFQKIIPSPQADVIMVAPRMIGEGVRDLYSKGAGYPCFVAVEQDCSGKGLTTALAIAKGIGATKIGATQVTFKQETIMDLFAEQATWPLIEKVLVSAFEFQVAQGLPAAAVLSELYLSKEPAYMFEKMADIGFFKQMDLHSRTSQYGQLSRFEQVDATFIQEFMSKAFKEINDGRFAEEWEQEQATGMNNFKKLKSQALAHEMNQVEDQVKGHR